METYRKLLALRNEHDLYSAEWNELTEMIDSYVRAQILAGNMDFAKMLVSDLCDLAENGSYEDDPEAKKEYDSCIKWFRKWGFDEYANELESCIEC